MSELKPCPFCGGEAEMHHEGRGDVWVVSCKVSRCAGYEEFGAWGYETKHNAIEAWNTRHEQREYLLEHFRRCGEFKCAECLYSLCEDSIYGKLYDCKYPGTLRHKALKDQGQVMHSTACCWFEPMAHAGEHVAERNARQLEVWRKVLDYAWAHTHVTERHETIDEKRLLALQKELSDLGVMGV